MSFLFAIFVQNLVELLQLPGLEEDRAFQKEIGLKTLVFKAYRYSLTRRVGLSTAPQCPVSLGNTSVSQKIRSLAGCRLPCPSSENSQPHVIPGSLGLCCGFPSSLVYS